MGVKNRIPILFISVFILLAGAQAVRGGLVCYTDASAPYCKSGELDLFSMSDFTNAHAAVVEGYDHHVCCYDTSNPGGLTSYIVTGEGSECPVGGSPQAPVMRLFQEWNAHVQNPYIYTDYEVLLCLSAPDGVECIWGEYNIDAQNKCRDAPGEGYVCVAAVYRDDNSHIGYCSEYSERICCRVAPVVQCNLVSIDTVDTAGCTGAGGKCEAGDTLKINATVEGNCTDEGFWHLQVDAVSDDGMCVIEYGASPGNISGMNNDVGDLVGNDNLEKTVEAEWTVLDIPSYCANKGFTVGTWGPWPPSCLRNDYPGEPGVDETCTSDVSGTFTLGDATSNPPVIEVRRVGKDAHPDPYYKAFGIQPPILVTAWDPDGVSGCTIEGSPCGRYSGGGCAWSGDCFMCAGQALSLGTFTESITCTDTGGLPGFKDVTYITYDTADRPTPWGIVAASSSEWSCDFYTGGGVRVYGPIFDPSSVEELEWSLGVYSEGEWNNVQGWTDNGITANIPGVNVDYEYTIPYSSQTFLNPVAEDIESWLRVKDGAGEVITSWGIIKPPPADWLC